MLYEVITPHETISPDEKTLMPEKKKIVFSNGGFSGILVYVPVTYHTYNSTPVGTVVMGRYFSEPFLDEISLGLKNRIKIIPKNIGYELFSNNNSISQNIKILIVNNSVV